jgi:hypothetical protein
VRCTFARVRKPFVGVGCRIHLGFWGSNSPLPLQNVAFFFLSKQIVDPFLA